MDFFPVWLGVLPGTLKPIESIPPNKQCKVKVNKGPQWFTLKIQLTVGKTGLWRFSTLYRGCTSYITLWGWKRKVLEKGLCWILWNFQPQKMCRSSSTLSLSWDIYHFHQHPLSGTRIARAFCWDAPSLEYPSLSDQKKGWNGAFWEVQRGIELQ